MNKAIPFLFLVGIFSISAAYRFSPGIKIGDTIPKADLLLKDISGKDITLNAALKGNGLLVMFSCNTCPYVVKNQSATKAVCRYALSKDIGVVLLNANEGQRSTDDSFEEMKTFAADQEFNWYYAVDRDNVLANAFGASRTPEVYLFDKNKKLVYHGAINDNPSEPSDVKRMHLRIAMNEMIDGKAVSVAETRSVGCGIKRIN